MLIAVAPAFLEGAGLCTSFPLPMQLLDILTPYSPVWTEKPPSAWQFKALQINPIPLSLSQAQPVQG